MDFFFVLRISLSSWKLFFSNRTKYFFSHESYNFKKKKDPYYKGWFQKKHPQINTNIWSLPLVKTNIVSINLWVYFWVPPYRGIKSIFFLCD